MRTSRRRLLAALAALSVNALLLGALTLTGRADAEPSSASSAAALIGDPAKEPTKTQVEEAPKEAPKKAPKKSIVRKVLPVRDFGGY